MPSSFCVKAPPVPSVSYLIHTKIAYSNKLITLTSSLNCIGWRNKYWTIFVHESYLCWTKHMREIESQALKPCYKSGPINVRRTHVSQRPATDSGESLLSGPLVCVLLLQYHMDSPACVLCYVHILWCVLWNLLVSAFWL